MPPPPPPVPLRFIPKDPNNNNNKNNTNNTNTLPQKPNSILSTSEAAAPPPPTSTLFTGGIPTNTAPSPPRFEEINGTLEDGLQHPNSNSSSLPKLGLLSHTQPISTATAITTANTTTATTTTTKTPFGSTSHSNGISSEPTASLPLPFPFSNSLPSAHTSSASSSSSSTQQIAQLWQLVQDLTSENAVLQQRMRVLMEGEINDVNLPGMMMSTATGSGSSTIQTTTAANTSTMMTSGCSPAEAEALILRIRRLEAALKVEAMEREALEVRLQAQERVLAKLVMR
ncbi:uncharacterized protein TM35_000321950 [Trypanosoma theileri]|uniref:Uncharacterized protein n=1 Tax=Trypanosoma theileri TaxID=67003 RepID=A0A1X0NP21_9TRYP|nr:uncharacterized protein TM35_000321950 [Trypanosoma theileri]ORC85880.1 hypothetical protein TM35_000321950 [Trypanosoma theileri]